MKKYIIIPLLFSIAMLSGCKKFLDRKPLDASTASTFLSNQPEMEQGLNGVYASAFWVMPNNTPLLFAIETTTDVAIKRTGNAEDQVAMGDGGPFLVSNSLTTTAWNQAYKLVQRANQQIIGMENGRASVDAKTYGKLKAEALVLRAWAYLHLMTWFGDVPFYTKSPAVNEVLTASRSSIATIVPELYKDLDEAVAAFDAASTPAVQTMGRVNKGVALGLKAKLALLIKDYRTAATATKVIIDGAQYGLNPRYTDLFMLAGQQVNANREIMFNQTYPTDVLDPQNWLSVLTIPRQVGTSQSSHFPSQTLVDRFEARDGLRIDASLLYDPANPRLNRDNRLKWTVYMQDDTMVHNTSKTPALPYVQPKERTIFNIYSNVRRKFNWNTGVFDNLSSNIDWIGFLNSPWFAGATGSSGGVGYVWRKYIDSTQYSWETKTGYINLRYADILLMYAEAKTELNEIDGTVTGAINLVRNRAGQPSTVAATQTQLRQIIRRERVVEFGAEGLRLFDLRRWNIYEKAVSRPVIGVSLNPLDPAANPVFDGDEIPDYTSSIAKRLKTRNQIRNSSNPKYKLWPIPQFEIDVNPKLIQNTGW